MTLTAMSILHNCAETDENKKYFYNEPDMISVIAWYAKNTSQEDKVSEIIFRNMHALKARCSIFQCRL